VVADMLIRAEADGFLITTDPELRAPLGALLDRYVVMDDVTIEDATEATAELGLYGPAASEAAAQVAGLQKLDAPLGLHVVGESALVRGMVDELVHGGHAVRLDE